MASEAVVCSNKMHKSYSCALKHGRNINYNSEIVTLNERVSSPQLIVDVP